GGGGGTMGARGPPRGRCPARGGADRGGAALVSPPMSSGTIISPWTRPNGSLAASFIGAYGWTVSCCPVCLAAASKRNARSAGARSLIDGTTIRVLEVPGGISAPRVVG